MQSDNPTAYAFDYCHFHLIRLLPVAEPSRHRLQQPQMVARTIRRQKSSKDTLLDALAIQIIKLHARRKLAERAPGAQRFNV